MTARYIVFSLFSLITVGLTIQFFYNVFAARLDFLLHLWNIVDLMCIVMSLGYIIMSIVLQAKLMDLEVHGTAYYHFWQGLQGQTGLSEEDFKSYVEVIGLNTQLHIIGSALIMVFFLRLCRFVQYEGRIGLVTSMLIASAVDTIHFLIFMGFYMVGFGLGEMIACLSLSDSPSQTLSVHMSQADSLFSLSDSPTLSLT